MECKPEPRLCQNPKCKKPLEKKKNESKYRFEKRKTCDRQCSDMVRVINRLKFGNKICKDCGEKFYKSAFMSASRWEGRARCEKCARERQEKFKDKNGNTKMSRKAVWKDRDGMPTLQWRTVEGKIVKLHTF